ncbi:MAG: hypothetical protein K6E91_07130, partial [Butyrivibrio sp.]|nr:hypothetical protein [Butyrivibrio sp.]
NDIYLAVAKEILESNFDKNEFAIGTRKDCAVCIEEKCGEWIVYETEKGNDYDKASFMTVIEALMNMFDRLSMNPKEIKNAFLSELTSKMTA